MRETASAAENNRHALCVVRVKMWGKSSRRGVVTHREGKPYGLKGHVHRGAVNSEWWRPA